MPWAKALNLHMCLENYCSDARLNQTSLPLVKRIPPDDNDYSSDQIQTPVVFVSPMAFYFSCHHHRRHHDCFDYYCLKKDCWHCSPGY